MRDRGRRWISVSRAYPRGLLVLAVATFVLFLARGMVLPFLVIYFAQVVGLGEGLAGLGIALSSILGVIATVVLAGTIDRYGARRIVLLALLALALAHGLLWLGQTPTRFLALMAFFGIAVNVYWPASDTLATTFLPAARAGEVFALQRVANALGLGLGGMLGGTIVSGGDVPAYRILFLASAAGILLAACLVGRSVPDIHPGHRATAVANTQGGWRSVLRDRRFLASQLVLLLAIAGFTQFQVTVPPFLRREAQFSEGTIGLMFAANTALVILAQVPFARWSQGRSHASLFAATGVLWAFAYSIFAVTPLDGRLATPAVLFYSLAELLFMPASGALVVALVPPALRARYLAFSSVVWAIGWGGTAWLAGTLLEAGAMLLLWGGTVVMMLTMGLLAWLVLPRAPQPAEPATLAIGSEHVDG